MMSRYDQNMRGIVQKKEGERASSDKVLAGDSWLMP
jgi:hypothetical protein